MKKKKTNWIHVNFWFKYNDLDMKTKVRRMLFMILAGFTGYFSRAFYLFEPDPHLFFAFEIPDRNKHKVLSKIIYDLKRREFQDKYWDFVKEITITFDTNDQEKGNGFLDMLWASTKFNLIYEDNNRAHVLHCCCNNSFMDRAKEDLFYRCMAKMYGSL